MAAAVPSRPRKPSGPPSPSSCRKATPTTTVGSTNGTSSSARTTRRPRKVEPVQGVRRRQAEQRPTSAVPAAADQSVNHSTRCTRGRPSTSATPAGSNAPSGQKPLGEHPAHRQHEEHAEHQRPAPSASAARASRRLVIGCVTGWSGRSTRSARRRGSSAISAGSTSYGAVGCRRTSPSRRAARHRRSTGKTYMLSGSAACTSSAQQEVDQRLGALGVVGAGEHAGVLDLAEAGVEQRAGRGLVLALRDGERRRGVVGQHDRPVASAAALGEVDRSRRRSSRRRQLGAVVDQPLPSSPASRRRTPRSCASRNAMPGRAGQRATG